MKFDHKFFKEQMKVLRANFVEHMNEPIVILQTTLNEIGSSKLTDERIEEIRSIAHNYKGTGTTYDFKEITKSAAVLEKLLLKSPKREDSKYIEPITTLLENLQKAVEGTKA